MRNLTILSIFLFFVFLFTFTGCNGITTPPSTPTPTPTVAPSTGSISGIVTEKGTGTPLSGVTITVDGSTTVTTGTDGSYSIVNLSPGFHTLKFEKVGYKTVTTNVNVIAGVNAPKAIQMENTTADTIISVYQDTYIYSGCSPKGNDTDIQFGAAIATADARMLLQFPFYTYVLPPGAKVISAKLKLYKTFTIPVSGSPVPYKVYPVKEPWDEAVATWTVRTSGFPWFTPGGSYYDDREISQGSFTLGSLLSWEEVDITKAFEYWMEDGIDDNGIVIVTAQSTLSVLAFASSETTPPEYTPYVEIEYYVP